MLLPGVFLGTEQHNVIVLLIASSFYRPGEKGLGETLGILQIALSVPLGCIGHP